jgi:hypothetical protein
MCLITRQQRSYKAKKDIVVYKIFTSNTLFLKLKSPFRNHLYNSLKLQPIVKMTKEEDGMSFDGLDSQACYNSKDKRKIHFITTGYHSVLKLNRLDVSHLGDGRRVVECIIPAGSLYYKGYTNLIVSNQLIIPKEEVYKVFPELKLTYK